MRFSLFLFVLLQFISGEVLSQADTALYRHQFSLSYGPGILWAHRSNMSHLIGKSIQSFEAELEFKTNKSKYWKIIYNQPSYGFRLHYADLGNPTIGSAIGALTYFNFTILQSKKLEWRTAWGIGLAYLTQRFDLQNNRKNIAIGSALNLYASFNTSLQYHLTRSLHLSLRAQFSHYSNAAYSMPNLGFNIPSLTTGVIWVKPKKSVHHHLFQILPIKNKWSYNLISGFGLRSVEVLNQKRYPVFRLSAEFENQRSYKWAIVPAVDFYYNSAIFNRLESAATAPAWKYNSQLGLSCKYHQIVGRVQMMLGMGAYVLDKAQRDGFFYHKLGARIDLNEKWMLNSILFTHWAKADHFEIGLGYKLL